jgi:hypothetical protein
MVMDFPANTFAETVIITHTAFLPADAPSPAADLVDIGRFYGIEAIYGSTGQPAQPSPGRTYTVTISYSEEEKGPVIEDTLALYYWNGDQWVPETSSVDATNRTVTATPDHLSTWAVLGETRHVYLPIVLTH